jgi:hypothetical protein
VKDAGTFVSLAPSWRRLRHPQPFGGARASGTNDKAGSILNLVRWISPSAIKETFAPPHAFEYPFRGKKKGRTADRKTSKGAASGFRPPLLHPRRHPPSQSVAGGRELTGFGVGYIFRLETV